MSRTPFSYGASGSGLNGQISTTGGILDTSAGNDILAVLYGSSYFFARIRSGRIDLYG